MPQVSVVQGDITQVRCDAVVNAANTHMRGGGGVDGAIHRAGGPAILADCVARFPNGLATGRAGYTTAGELPARFVIHTVGPNYVRGQRDRGLLESCYRSSLAVADEIGARRVAFPLISAGVYGWPIEDAIAVAVDTVLAATTDVEDVTFVAFDDELAGRLRGYLQVSTPLGLLAGIREAHRRGHGDIRFVPYIYAVGTWRLEISTAINVEDQVRIPTVRDRAPAVRYSSASGPEFAGGRVTASTPARAVSDLIVSGLLDSSSPRDADPRYLAWLDEVIAVCERTGSVPYAFSEESRADRGRWHLSGTSETVPIPPPGRGRPLRPGE